MGAGGNSNQAPQARGRVDRKALAEVRDKPEGLREGTAWFAFETKHYVLMFDKIARLKMDPARFKRKAEERLHRIGKFLGLRRTTSSKRYPLGPQIPYFIHDPRRCKRGGYDDRGLDMPACLRSVIYKGQEAKAVLARALGKGVPFFLEGFAAHVRGRGSDENDAACVKALEVGALLPLRHFIGVGSFWNKWVDCHWFLFEMAGSVTGYLIGKFGVDKFRDFFGRLEPHDGQAKVHRKFEKIYGVGVMDINAMWRKWLIRRGKVLAKKGPT